MEFATDNLFKKYDTNHTNKLEPHEVAILLRDAYRNIGSRQNVTADKIKLFISRFDQDGDFKISKEEMMAALKDNFF